MCAKTRRFWVRVLRASASSLILWPGISPVVAATYSFTNSALVRINNSTNSLTKSPPYPSANLVSGLAGQVVTKATLTLQGFSHSFPSDASILVVGPQGQSAVVMSETGGQVKHSVSNLTLVLDDDATDSLPVLATLFSGTFKPTDGYLALGYPNLPYDFPAPAPVGNSNSPASLSVFKNTDPTGVWNLFVLCDSAGTDTGSLANGWSLNLSVSVPLTVTLSQPNAILSWPASATNCHLQSLSGPLGVAGWSNVLTAPFQSSGVLYVTNPISGGAAFFRLVGN